MSNCNLETVAACPGADCVNVVGSFKCKCKEGFKIVAGQCRDIDECTNGSHDCASVASGQCIKFELIITPRFTLLFPFYLGILQ